MQYATILGLIAVVALLAISQLGIQVKQLLGGVTIRLCNGAGACDSSAGGGSGNGASNVPTVLGWGVNSFSQIGDGTAGNSSKPVGVVGVGGAGYLSDVTQVFAGGNHSCAVTSAGQVFCWGVNSTGQLGDTTTSGRVTPVSVSGVGGSGVLTGVSKGSGGLDHSCAIVTGGEIRCWGKGTAYQLGNNVVGNRTSPVAVLGVGGSGVLTNASDIAMGENFGCARIADGMYCWGANNAGQIGNGSASTSIPTAVQVVGLGGSGLLTDVQTIAVGRYTSCAADSTYLYCWGSNSSAVVGINVSGGIYNTPQKVLGVGGTGFLTGVTAVNIGWAHVCAIASAGSVYCWGDNGNGGLGDNTTTARWTPVQVKGVGGAGTLSGASQITARLGYSCAKLGSQAYCWGSNSSGMLGTNNTTEYRVPTAVVDEAGVSPLTGISSLSLTYSQSQTMHVIR